MPRFNFSYGNRINIIVCISAGGCKLCLSAVFRAVRESKLFLGFLWLVSRFVFLVTAMVGENESVFFTMRCNLT